MNSEQKNPKQKSVLIRSSLSVAILTMFLHDCGGATFDRYRCPTLTKYSKSFQEKAADELPKAGTNVKQLVSDYGQLRDACRAMEATK